MSKDIELLKQAGNALYGTQWQSDLARQLGFKEARRIRQWLTGDRPIPATVWDTIKNLLKQNKAQIEKEVNNIDKFIREQSK